ncbi:DNA polymerase III subunit beta [bacterium]|nr:DNA polymerase III subunit beta [bacterium]
MKIICSKDELLKGLQIVQLAISSKTNLPILTNFLMETQKDKIKMAATDLEVGIKCFIKGEIIKKGSISIPAKKFMDIIRELPKNEVLINVKDNQINITSGQAKFSITGISSEEFPVLPGFTQKEYIEIKAEILKEMIQKTIFATSRDESRYVLNGIYLVIEGKKIKMVATDGRRLCFITKELDNSTCKKEKIEIIIPSKAVNELKNLLTTVTEEKDKIIKISIEENQIIFKLDDTILISRLIEGRFPNYEQVIPVSSKLKVKLDVEKFFRSTKRVAVLTNERSNSVKYILEKDKLKILANTIGLGEAEDEINIDYDNEQIEIAYNPNYVMDILKNINVDEIYLELNEPLSPGVIKPVENEDYLCVIMPMKI